MKIRILQAGDAAAYWHLRYEALLTEPLAFGRATEEHEATTVDEIAALISETKDGGFVLGGFQEDALVAIARLSREAGIKERHKGHIYGST
jgi:hypothetical protein